LIGIKGTTAASQLALQICEQGHARKKVIWTRLPSISVPKHFSHPAPVYGGAEDRGHYRMDNNTYERQLRELQIELVRAQKHIIKHGHKTVVIFEGRDASGKGGAIKRIVEHLSPRETRVVALGIPSDRDRASWYFQRYVPHLPAAQEIVLLNRSWYNRAGVERVMNFCTSPEFKAFFAQVLPFEHMLIESGIQIVKYYLDISRKEQKKRLKSRANDPLKQWKVSPIDRVALGYWEDYSVARNDMLERTSSRQSPWIIIRTDDKREARLNVIRDLLARLKCSNGQKHLGHPDRSIVFEYDRGRSSRLAQ
jgi:polyphosphate kinase 2